MRRRRLTRRANRRIFTKYARRVNRRNLTKYVPRGGVSI